ncbi:hypothetical protein [Anaerocolumna xylanovorans]|uniref:hypothetical protein n=1 Tax=Anaerocolumna xylanovorans TaxID=100134 RepID=UPI0015880D21|nr:hypothetical protein [Anaerocolumna xylanovorans]
MSFLYAYVGALAQEIVAARLFRLIKLVLVSENRLRTALVEVQLVLREHTNINE